MGIGVRYFLVDDHDALLRLSVQRLADLDDGRTSLPEFAGKTVRYLQVAVEVENRRVVGIHSIEGLKFKLDTQGRFSKEAQRAKMRTAVNAVDFGLVFPKRGPNVAEAAYEFARRAYKTQYRWKPSPAVLDEVTRVLLGNDSE